MENKFATASTLPAEPGWRAIILRDLGSAEEQDATVLAALVNITAWAIEMKGFDFTKAPLMGPVGNALAGMMGFDQSRFVFRLSPIFDQMQPSDLVVKLIPPGEGSSEAAIIEETRVWLAQVETEFAAWQKKTGEENR